MNYILNGHPVTAPVPPTPPAVALHGTHISLLPMAEATDDMWAQLFAASHGDDTREAVWEYMLSGPFADVGEMRADYQGITDRKEAQFYVVHHKEADKVAGVVSYLRIQPAAYSIEIGHIWHAPECQRGYANTEASYLLTENAFKLGYRRVEWKCNALNMKSRLAALRLGFAFEGIFRRCIVIRNRNRDTAWFAVLSDDWDVARKNYQEWLAAPSGELSLAKMNLPLVEWSFKAHDAWEVTPGAKGT